MQGVDLHTHSNISDGTLSPELLVHAALEKGIHTLALTDHDSMDGLILAENIAKNHPIQIISGVEISSQWSRPSTNKSYGVHIVALNMQNPEPLQRLLEQQKKIRAERSKQICDLLIPLIQMDIYPDVIAQVDGEAFDKYIKEGKKAYVKFDGLGLEETIKVIHESKGYAVLAHPTRYDLSATNVRYLIELFAQHGGDAIELPPAIEPLSTRQIVDRMIQQFNLKVSVGSDFHGDNMPWIKLGSIPKVKEGQVGIWESFV